MKKRILAVFLTVALLLALFLPWAGSVDVDHIYFMGVNDNLYPKSSLTDDNMPVVSGGVLYVPYTILDAGNTGVSLSVYYNYSRQLDTFTIYDRDRMLVFSISGGTCKGKDVQYESRVIARNGKIYIPIEFVCDFFGLTCSIFPITLAAGTVTMVRVSNDMASRSDRSFADGAIFLMIVPLNEYLRSQVTPTPAVTPPPNPTPTAAPPATPGVSPATPGATPSAPPVDHRDVAVSLAFRCTAQESLAPVTQSLERAGISALFLFRPEDLAQRDEDVRDLLAHGHQVGLLLDPANAAAEFARGNELLAHIARMRTRIVASTGGTLPGGEWVVFSENVGDPLRRSNTSTGLVRATLSALETMHSPARILLDDSNRTFGALGRILTGLVDGKYTLRTATEQSLG
ncbi:MAG: hypothetical protein RSC08_06680 [Oscillospiraceae bacterium]